MVLGGAEAGRGLDAAGTPRDDEPGPEERGVSLRDVVEGLGLQGGSAALSSDPSMNERRLTGWTYNDGGFRKRLASSTSSVCIATVVELSAPDGTEQ